jgi:signal transduction histidine kinase
MGILSTIRHASMEMKSSLFWNWKNKKYKQWMLLYLFVIFILFTVSVMAIIRYRSMELKKGAIQSNLNVYTSITSDYIERKNLFPLQLDSLNTLFSYFPDSMRLTILDENGDILFNRFPEKGSAPNNWKKKSEIKKALIKGKGWDIRESAENGHEYMYYAIYKNNYIIRIAVPYSARVKAYFQPDVASNLFILSLFALIFFLHLSIFLLFRRSVFRLKEFILSFWDNQVFPNAITLPDGELREIQEAIVKIYEQLEMKERDTLLEQEKLLEHFHFSEEGISFFTPFFENIYTNSNFMHYLNTLLNEPTIDVRNLFHSPVFSEVLRFLEDPGKENMFTTKLHANGCHFVVQVVIFDDKSFEIIIRDISESEKIHIDRAEMTNNIAHELRTPVTSVRGYLETLMEHPDMPAEKKKEYIERAHNQIIRLSQIIQDVVLLSKTNDAPQYFVTEPVNIYDLLKEMLEVVQEEIQRHHCTVNLFVPPHAIVKGNRTLLYSIFFNLCTNALKYAGENITITIHNYMEDDEYYYFSFSDNGIGIEEKYFDHIFERFYRITEGRTRDKGGSGLGLSIVKDAVNFHKGRILVKNRSKGGLEFLFTIRKH